MQTVDSQQTELLSLLMRKTIAGSAAGGRRVVDVGPFVAAIHETDPMIWLSYALPWPGRSPEQFSRAHIVELRRLFRDAGRTLRFEYFEPLHPWLGAFLAQNDLQLQGAQPLMLCPPSDLLPVRADEVEVHDLVASDSDETISQFMIVAKLCFGEPPSVSPQDIESTRQNLRSRVYRSAYAKVRGVMAGVGSLSLANDELVGIGTLAPFRRRGVASTISSRLLEEHFRAGAPMAWLSAGDDAARATYQSIGFQTVGMQLNYIDLG
jgi:ribosomal protein S18 acetylase RimI-like enzyme